MKLRSLIFMTALALPPTLNAAPAPDDAISACQKIWRGVALKTMVFEPESTRYEVGKRWRYLLISGAIVGDKPIRGTLIPFESPHPYTIACIVTSDGKINRNQTLFGLMFTKMDARGRSINGLRIPPLPDTPRTGN